MGGAKYQPNYNSNHLLDEVKFLKAELQNRNSQVRSLEEEVRKRNELI